MTVDNLIAEARRNRSGPASADALSLSSLSGFLRLALGHLLEDVDYEANLASGAAIAARVLATIISGADEATVKRGHSMSNVVKFPNLASRIENLPKEEKRVIAAQIEAKIESEISALKKQSLGKQCAARYEAWGNARCEAIFRKALADLQHALYVAQREKMPEALLYDPVELGSASWHATRQAYQNATDRQLLTPAPNMEAVRWKQGQKFSCLPRDKIEKAIANDLAWLKKYPARLRRVRRPTE